MENIKILFILAIILSSQTSAEDISPIGSSTVDINMSGELRIVGDNADVKWMTFEMNIPVDDQNQGVDATSNQRYNINSNENESLFILEWQNPSDRVIYYNINIRVKRDSFSVPITSNQRGHNPGYLKVGELTQCNAEIKSKAQQLSEGADNDLIIIGTIAQWVHKNIEYDLGLSGEIKPDQWIFENRRGTCVEFSTLFISMCRSLGIPARSVSGLSYGGDKWEAHSWAEVFLGERWVPVDPTNNQVGFVDGAHITYSRALEDAEIKYRVSWRGSNILNVSRSESRVVKFIEIRPSEKLIDIDIDFNSDNKEITKKDVNITANLISLSNSHIIGSIRIITPRGIIVDEKEKLFYLEPNGKSKVKWTAELENISFGYIYKYPIYVNSVFPYSKSEKELIVKLAPVDVKIEDITLLRTVDGGSINVEIKNAGPESKDVTVKICLWGYPNENKSCRESKVYLEGGSTDTESFEFPVPCVNYTSEYISEITVISGGEILDKKKIKAMVGGCNKCEINLILWKTIFIAEECWIYKLIMFFIFIALLSIILHYYQLYRYQRS